MALLCAACRRDYYYCYFTPLRLLIVFHKRMRDSKSPIVIIIIIIIIIIAIQPNLLFHISESWIQELGF